MTKCTTPTASFPRGKGRQVTAGFDGGEIASDGGTVVIRNTRRIRLMLSSRYPDQNLFLKLVMTLVPG